ncbi:patatin-like phospholipase family protein [Candidatus Peregrinibacteria bacterium]|nr:patatin-like phospholipase family protein [Candidatus Peregrinibacteria bacterium]
MKHKRKIVGLALGGGGARGCAHIGVIKALREAHIPIDCVAGTSIGALVGGVYASGKIKELESFLRRLNSAKKILSHLDIALSNKGLLNGDKVKRLLSERFIEKLIEDTSIPFVAVAADLQAGKEVHFKTGSLADAIRASISIPGIFVPAQLNGDFLADGGLLNPLPINAVRALGAEVVVAVDLNAEVGFKKATKIRRSPRSDTWWDKLKEESRAKLREWMSEAMRPNLVDILDSSVTIMQKGITEANLRSYPADFLIRPRVGRIMLFDFHLARFMIDEGYLQAQKIIPALKKAL